MRGDSNCRQLWSLNVVDLLEFLRSECLYCEWSILGHDYYIGCELGITPFPVYIYNQGVDTNKNKRRS
jgi:hypothetical protein